jgi:hypothetical protein
MPEPGGHDAAQQIQAIDSAAGILMAGTNKAIRRKITKPGVGFMRSRSVCANR